VGTQTKPACARLRLLGESADSGEGIFVFEFGGIVLVNLWALKN
jgi:hypothetical protein